MSVPLPPEAYRYLLSRRVVGDLLINARGTLLWFLLNPSKAEAFDATKDDPTTRKVKEQTRRWGFREARIVNLYAYRATKPLELWAHLAAGADVVGPDNDSTIIAEAERADAIVCGWGRLPLHAWKRKDELLEKLWALTPHDQLYCVGRNGDGSPLHPCFAPYISNPVVWKVRKAA